MAWKNNLFLALFFVLCMPHVVAFDKPTELQKAMTYKGLTGPRGARGPTGNINTYEVQLNAHEMAKNGTTYPTTIINNMFGSTSGILNVNFTTFQIPNQTAPATETPIVFEFRIPSGAASVAGNVPYTLNLHVFTIGQGEGETSTYTVQLRARAAYRSNATALNPGITAVSETVFSNAFSVTETSTLNTTNHYLVSIAMPGVGATPGNFGLIAIDQPNGNFDPDDNLYLAVAHLVFTAT